MQQGLPEYRDMLLFQDIINLVDLHRISKRKQEEVQHQVQHALGPCILSYSAWTSSLTAASSFLASVIVLVYRSIFNNKVMCSDYFGVDEWIYDQERGMTSY